MTEYVDASIAAWSDDTHLGGTESPDVETFELSIAVDDESGFTEVANVDGNVVWRGSIGSHDDLATWLAEYLNAAYERVPRHRRSW